MTGTDSTDLKAILQKYWGYPDFRGIQKDIIDSICQGNDTLGLMPTGGGKSITFQVPALAMDGVCIVITPLIALMKDQVAHLRKNGIRAAAINSSMTHGEVVNTLENAILGNTKLLYISPERLNSELFQRKLSHVNVSFVTVDEAHCISQWGYDFRPSYLHIARIRTIIAANKKNAGRVPILALTATATPRVVSDIQQRLEFNRENVFRMSFRRDNLAYVVRHATDKLAQMAHILNAVGGSAIVYVRSRKRTREIADHLVASGISALAYHAGLENVVRDQRQRQWHDGSARVMVATNAFGMGIDKPDVRLVIHIDCPDSIEAYFQEAGRAGRDGKKAYAVMLYNDNDKRKLSKRVDETFPPKDYIRTVYEHLAYFYQIGVGSGLGSSFEFNIDKFCHAFRHFPVQVHSALNILTRAGYIEYEEEHEAQARVHFLLSRNQLYLLQQQSEEETAIITALLRTYGGLFTDYKYIDLAYMAQLAGMKGQQEAYIVLKRLSDRRILHFIPQKKTPYITYTREREDGHAIDIPPSVYEERKEQYAKRIKAIIEYANNGDVCRSRQLISYFGETKSKDCGVCDVCVSRQPDYLSENKVEPARQQILSLLGDHQLHPLFELNRLNIPTDILDNALQYLVSEDIIHIKGSMIYLT